MAARKNESNLVISKFLLNCRSHASQILTPNVQFESASFDASLDSVQFQFFEFFPKNTLSDSVFLRKISRYLGNEDIYETKTRALICAPPKIVTNSVNRISMRSTVFELRTSDRPVFDISLILTLFQNSQRPEFRDEDLQTWQGGASYHGACIPNSPDPKFGTFRPPLPENLSKLPFLTLIFKKNIHPVGLELGP